MSVSSRGDGKSQDVPALLVPSFDDLPHEQIKPGMFEYYVSDKSPFPGKTAGIIFFCPCGCHLPCLSFRYAGVDRPSWIWDNNREKPTLTPSINNPDGCKWHGYLTAGVFVPTPDRRG
jgi:hypothetical protein